MTISRKCDMAWHKVTLLIITEKSLEPRYYPPSPAYDNLQSEGGEQRSSPAYTYLRQQIHSQNRRFDQERVPSKLASCNPMRICIVRSNKYMSTVGGVAMVIDDERGRDRAENIEVTFWSLATIAKISCLSLCVNTYFGSK